jgi:serine/threonine-protein kinase
MTALQPGSTLGKYQLLVRIGHGGMASVWVARERSRKSGRQRLVAVKAMLPQLARQATFRAMFLEEVQLVRSIQHENIVQVYDVSEDSGILYMAMEWVEGESLRNVIRAASGRRPIPADIAVHVISDAAAGLHAAHELRGWDGELRGVVHCDVSPHNILLGVDGRPKLVDFGVAGALEHVDGQGVKGKVGYMAPEQARGGSVDRRTDVYALGIVLFELTTGTLLFATGSREETLKLVADPVIPLPTDVTPHYPTELENIVLRALERNPELRYQTALELQMALRQYLVNERVVVSRAGVAQLMRKVVGQRVKQRRQQIAGMLRQMDGQVPEELVAQWPGLASPGYWSLHTDETVSSSPASATLTDTEPSAHHQTFSSTGTSLVVTRRGLSWSATLGLVLGVATLALAVGYLLSERARAPRAEQPPTEPPSTAGSIVSQPAGSRTARIATPPGRADGESVSIDSLPWEGQGRVGAWQPRGRTDQTGASEVVLEDSANRTTKPFDQPRAQIVLSQVRAAAAGCGAVQGPKGAGVATVTFGNHGGILSVQLPNRFDGTAVGSCVTAKFARARVPAFEGSAVTLSQSFNVP